MSLRALAAVALPAIAVAGCATTARLHSEAELAQVTRRCGVALGDLAQFEEEPRLVFLVGVERPAQFVCISRWARSRGLRLVYMEEEAEVVP